MAHNLKASGVKQIAKLDALIELPLGKKVISQTVQKVIGPNFPNQKSFIVQVIDQIIERESILNSSVNTESLWSNKVILCKQLECS